jgi:hypothetical protein
MTDLMLGLAYPGATIVELAEALKKQSKGVSWSAGYGKTHGTLLQFVQTYPLHFTTRKAKWVMLAEVSAEVKQQEGRTKAQQAKQLKERQQQQEQQQQQESKRRQKEEKEQQRQEQETQEKQEQQRLRQAQQQQQQQEAAAAVEASPPASPPMPLSAACVDGNTLTPFDEGFARAGLAQTPAPHTAPHTAAPPVVATADAGLSLDLLFPSGGRASDAAEGEGGREEGVERQGDKEAAKENAGGEDTVGEDANGEGSVDEGGDFGSPTRYTFAQHTPSPPGPISRKQLRALRGLRGAGVGLSVEAALSEAPLLKMSVEQVMAALSHPSTFGAAGAAGAAGAVGAAGGGWGWGEFLHYVNVQQMKGGGAIAPANMFFVRYGGGSAAGTPPAPRNRSRTVGGNSGICSFGHRSRSSSVSGSAAGGGVHGMNEWACSLCTFLNKPNSSKCEMCGGKMGASGGAGADVAEGEEEEEEEDGDVREYNENGVLCAWLLVRVATKKAFTLKAGFKKWAKRFIVLSHTPMGGAGRGGKYKTQLTFFNSDADAFSPSGAAAPKDEIPLHEFVRVGPTKGKEYSDRELSADYSPSKSAASSAAAATRVWACKLTVEENAVYDSAMQVKLGSEQQLPMAVFAHAVNVCLRQQRGQAAR